MITFTVHAIPVAQPRQRTRWTGTHVQNYTPVKHPVNAFKAAVQAALTCAYDGAPMGGAVGLKAKFYLPRPKTLIWSKKPMPATWHAKKPDLDNLIKSLKDALTGLAWRDDSQICYLNAYKFISAGGAQPMVIVHIFPCGDVLA